MSNEQIENATILNNTSLIIMSIGLFADKPQLIHVALVMVLISLIITLILLVRNFRFKNEEKKTIMVRACHSCVFILGFVSLCVFHLMKSWSYPQTAFPNTLTDSFIQIASPKIRIKTPALIL